MEHVNVQFEEFNLPADEILYIENTGYWACQKKHILGCTFYSIIPPAQIED